LSFTAEFLMCLVIRAGGLWPGIPIVPERPPQPVTEAHHD